MKSQYFVRSILFFKEIDIFYSNSYTKNFNLTNFYSKTSIFSYILKMPKPDYIYADSLNLDGHDLSLDWGMFTIDEINVLSIKNLKIKSRKSFNFIKILSTGSKFTRIYLENIYIPGFVKNFMYFKSNFDSEITIKNFTNYASTFKKILNALILLEGSGLKKLDFQDITCTNLRGQFLEANRIALNMRNLNYYYDDSIRDPSIEIDDYPVFISGSLCNQLSFRQLNFVGMLDVSLISCLMESSDPSVRHKVLLQDVNVTNMITVEVSTPLVTLKSSTYGMDITVQNVNVIDSKISGFLGLRGINSMSGLISKNFISNSTFYLEGGFILIEECNVGGLNLEKNLGLNISSVYAGGFIGLKKSGLNLTISDSIFKSFKTADSGSVGYISESPSNIIVKNNYYERKTFL